MDKDCNKLVNKWENLDNDILVRIFKRHFSIFELTSGLAHVCQRWRVACCDPILWNTFDLSIMKSHYIKITQEPYVYVQRRSDEKLTRILKLCMNLSQGNVKTLIFHFNLFVSDKQLTDTAERCPNLRRLVFPAWNRIKKTGITQAISMWKDLESLTMPSIYNPPYLFESISENCKNFTHLKIMGPFELFFAETLVQYLPNLKVLSLRCTAINRDALITILDGLPGLEILNISHSYLVVITKQPIFQKKITRELDETIVVKAARLKKFMTCMEFEICEMCKRTEKDEGILRWYKYEANDWKADETLVMSLQLWETVKEAITAYTGLSPATFFTVIALAVAFYHVVSGFFASPVDHQPRFTEIEREVDPLPPPIQLGEITEDELKQYDGSDSKKPLLMAIKGQIYDVSQSRMFYGPGGPYALFAGKDASRALAKMSFEDKDLTGDISGLGPFELDALQDWEYKFMSKYEKVGTIQKKDVVVTEQDSSVPSKTDAAEEGSSINKEEETAADEAAETLETKDVANGEGKKE